MIVFKSLLILILNYLLNFCCEAVINKICIMNVYTNDEKLKILEYISNKGAYYVLRGNAFWQALEKEAIIDRSWQSMKQHFKKNIIVNIKYFDLPEEEKRKITNGYNSTKTTKTTSDNKVVRIPLKKHNFDFSDDENKEDIHKENTCKIEKTVKKLNKNWASSKFFNSNQKRCRSSSSSNSSVEIVAEYAIKNSIGKRFKKQHYNIDNSIKKSPSICQKSIIKKIEPEGTNNVSDDSPAYSSKHLKNIRLNLKKGKFNQENSYCATLKEHNDKIIKNVIVKKDNSTQTQLLTTKKNTNDFASPTTNISNTRKHIVEHLSKIQQRNANELKKILSGKLKKKTFKKKIAKMQTFSDILPPIQSVCSTNIPQLDQIQPENVEEVVDVALNEKNQLESSHKQIENIDPEIIIIDSDDEIMTVAPKTDQLSQEIRCIKLEVDVDNEVPDVDKVLPNNISLKCIEQEIVQLIQNDNELCQDTNSLVKENNQLHIENDQNIVDVTVNDELQMECHHENINPIDNNCLVQKNEQIILNKDMDQLQHATDQEMIIDKDNTQLNMEYNHEIIDPKDLEQEIDQVDKNPLMKEYKEGNDKGVDQEIDQLEHANNQVKINVEEKNNIDQRKQEIVPLDTNSMMQENDLIIQNNKLPLQDIIDLNQGSDQLMQENVQHYQERNKVNISRKHLEQEIAQVDDNSLKEMKNDQLIEKNNVLHQDNNGLDQEINRLQPVLQHKNDHDNIDQKDLEQEFDQENNHPLTKTKNDQLIQTNHLLHLVNNDLDQISNQLEQKEMMVAKESIQLHHDDIDQKDLEQENRQIDNNSSIKKNENENDQLFQNDNIQYQDKNGFDKACVYNINNSK